MIAGLHDVAWGSLHGTHTSAEAVPGHLEALSSPDPATRRDALRELGRAVVHQGTRWQVSAHVVPFLVQLVDAPDTPSRDALAALLRDAGIGPRTDRDLPFDAAARLTTTATQQQEQRVIEQIYHQRQNELDAAAAADTDARVRKFAAAADPTADADARARRWTAAADATGPLAAQLDHPALVVRMTAAIALAYRLGPALPDRALDVLIDASTRDSLPPFPPAWPRAPRGLVALALQRLGLG